MSIKRFIAVEKAIYLTGQATEGASRRACASVTVAAMAVAVINPTPGIVSNRRLSWLVRCQARSSFSIILICNLRSISCATRGRRAMRAEAGRSMGSSPKTCSISMRTCLMTCATTIPNSARCARNASSSAAPKPWASSACNSGWLPLTKRK